MKGRRATIRPSKMLKGEWVNQVTPSTCELFNLPIEHAEQGCEGESSGEHGLHLDQRQIPVIILQLLFVPFQFLLLVLDQDFSVRLFELLDWKERGFSIYSGTLF